MSLSRTAVSLVTVTASVLLLVNTGSAANWGPNGHPEITFDVARGVSFQLPADVSRVMALGSIAPDYFEFTNPAAHAQSQNPVVAREGQPRLLSKEGCRTLRRVAFKESEQWHDHYLYAALAEMKSGHRERAAFLLGYAMHNSADFATHLLMSNLEHATLDDAGKSPDSSPTRLAKAHQLVRRDLEYFRYFVGEDDWRLFRGEVVRRPGSVAGTVPEPLTLIAPGLEKWDPRIGDIPPPPGQRVGLPDAVRRALLAFAHRPDVKGRRPQEWLAKVLNFVEGMYPRQQSMAILLKHSLRQFAPPSTPQPTAMDIGELERYLLSVVEFVDTLPRTYETLSTADKQVLHEVAQEQIWRVLLAEQLQQTKTYSQSYENVDGMRATRRSYEEAIESERLLAQRLKREQAEADAERRVTEYRRPPREDLAHASNALTAPSSPRSDKPERSTDRDRPERSTRSLRLPKSYGSGGFKW